VLPFLGLGDDYCTWASMCVVDFFVCGRFEGFRIRIWHRENNRVRRFYKFFLKVFRNIQLNLGQASKAPFYMHL